MEKERCAFCLADVSSRSIVDLVDARPIPSLGARPMPALAAQGLQLFVSGSVGIGFTGFGAWGSQAAPRGARPAANHHKGSEFRP